MDQIAQFITEQTYPSPGSICRAVDFLGALRAWAARRGTPLKLTRRDILKEVRRLGFPVAMWGGSQTAVGNLTLTPSPKFVEEHGQLVKVPR